MNLMKDSIQTSFATAFENDVYAGLTTYPKFLYSKYFYDSIGDKLFQDIMNLPEYYLTNCEYDILVKYADKISEIFKHEKGFDLIELGAGDGKKTKVLLKHLVNKNYDFHYLPIDISLNVLEELKASLSHEIPEVSVKIQEGTYFKTLEKLVDYNSRKKVIMVLGSNIGNLLHQEAIGFLRNIQESMSEDDLLFMGFDQKKNPQTVLDAYNDKTGVTAAFNKNILHRINKELDADFNPDNFLHWENYDPESGTAKSYLVSKLEQQVQINKLKLDVHFEEWETIHTEISQKYDDATVTWLAEQSGLKVLHSFTDDNQFYKDYIFSK